MADVKFMDLSENDNPATTDSLLIGSADDGLKRTPVSAIGNLFAVKGLLHFETITATNNPADASNGSSVPITAPDVPGYTFAFWLSPSSRGHLVLGYIEYANSNPATVFIPNANTASPTTMVCVAVYVNSKVA